MRIAPDDGRSAAAAVAMVSGLLISILQAATQINEQTLSFIPKIRRRQRRLMNRRCRLSRKFLAVAHGGPWMLNPMLDYIRTLFSNLPYIIG